MTPMFRQLHQEFLKHVRQPDVPGCVPIKVRPTDTPVIPMDRWELLNGGTELTKQFRFKSPPQRNEFVTEIFAYEAGTNHYGTLAITEEVVTVGIVTKGIGQTTELDREYARFCDVLYKDIVGR